MFNNTYFIGLVDRDTKLVLHSIQATQSVNQIQGHMLHLSIFLCHNNIVGTNSAHSLEVQS